MKLYIRTSLIVAAMAVGMSAFAEDETSVEIKDAEKVVITESPDGLNIIVDDGKQSETTVVQSYSSGSTVRSFISSSGISLTGRKKTARSGWDVVSGGFAFGFCSAANAPAAAQLEQGKSLELTWTDIVAVEYSLKGCFDLSLGIGIDWRNFRSTLGTNFDVDGNTVTYSQFADGINPRFSRIKIFTVQFPLLWRQYLPISNFNGKLNIHFGPIFCLNTHGSLLSRWYDEEGRSCKASVNSINLRQFTIDLYAKVNIANNIGVYVRYSPYNMLTGRQDFNFNPFSTGISFGM